MFMGFSFIYLNLYATKNFLHVEMLLVYQFGICFLTGNRVNPQIVVEVSRVSAACVFVLYSDSFYCSTPLSPDVLLQKAT